MATLPDGTCQGENERLDERGRGVRRLLALAEGDVRCALRFLDHFMIERTPGTFVLGDLGPVARMATTSDLVNPIVPGTTLSIYLPVSSGFVLCGHREEIEEDVDADALNLASVELSRDLFVAGRNTERERNYVKALGRRCQLLESTELDLKLFEFPS